MRCKVCGHEVLGETEYQLENIKATAFECARCHSIHLDERASETRVDPFRRAPGIRPPSLMPDSGTHATATASIPAGEVGAVIGEMDLVLAEARLALGFLEQRTDGEIGKAVADARHSVERVEGLIADLARRCALAMGRESDGSERPANRKAGP